MRLPRFRLGTLMIMVAVACALLAAGISIRHNFERALFAVTVVNETGTDIQIIGLTWSVRNRSTIASFDFPFGPGETILDAFSTEPGQSSLKIKCRDDVGRVVTGGCNVVMVGGCLTRVRCRLGRDTSGVKVEMLPEGQQRDLITLRNDALTLLAIVGLLTPIIFVAVVILYIIFTLRQDRIYAARLRRARDVPAVCPWPPAETGAVGPR